jgi:hypothetical protein
MPRIGWRNLSVPRGERYGMKRFFFGLVVGGFLGVAVGAAGMLFFYPFLFLNNIVADEKLQNAETLAQRASGAFIHANPSDPVHYGMGKVSVFDDTVRLEPDFVVGPGPKYKVLLHTARGIRKTDDIHAARYVDLGPLRAFKGSQNYTIPAGLSLAEFQSVVIWCEAFDVLISPADLTVR